MDKIGSGDWAVLAVGDAMEERNKARAVARQLWRAFRKMRLERNEYYVAAQDAFEETHNARNAAFEEAAHALLKHMGELQQKYRVHLDMVGHPGTGLGISIMETNCCAGIVRDLMSSDDEESDVTHES